jgi:excisionase family DNA binding protein
MPTPVDLTINDVAALLGVNRRTLERAIEDGTLVPTSRTASGRARFSQSDADELKSRADAARVAGYKSIRRPVTTPGPVLGPKAKRKSPPLTAEQWFRKVSWKRRHVARGPLKRTPS